MFVLISRHKLQNGSNLPKLAPTLFGKGALNVSPLAQNSSIIPPHTLVFRNQNRIKRQIHPPALVQLVNIHPSLLVHILLMLLLLLLCGVEVRVHKLFKRKFDKVSNYRVNLTISATDPTPIQKRENKQWLLGPCEKIDQNNQWFSTS